MQYALEHLEWYYYGMNYLLKVFFSIQCSKK